MVKSPLTFKQFLSEEDWTHRYTRRTPEEIQQIPTLSPSNADQQYRVGNVVFDQIKGVGAVPWNQEVMYKGFIAMMKPADFLAFTLPMEDSQDRVEKNITLIKQGIALGSPWLSVDFDGPWVEQNGMFRVVGHEGRARSRAIATVQPSLEIPVHIFVYQGNHKIINEEILSKLNSSICKEQTSTPVQGKISKVLYQYKWITL